MSCVPHALNLDKLKPSFAMNILAVPIKCFSLSTVSNYHSREVRNYKNLTLRKIFFPHLIIKTRLVFISENTYGMCDDLKHIKV